jgi:hypothetical protein
MVMAGSLKDGQLSTVWTTKSIAPTEIWFVAANLNCVRADVHASPIILNVQKHAFVQQKTVETPKI